MFDYEARIDELRARRFCCSQVVVALALELKGCDSPDVVLEMMKAMSGLCGGMGGSGNNCGALTGGACAIGLFCGNGEAGEAPDTKLHGIVRELIEWFEGEYGSVVCREIVGNDLAKRMELCPEIMKCTFESVVRILMENDVDIH